MEAAFHHLIEQEAGFKDLVAGHGLPPPRDRPPGFMTLLQIIVQQQVSIAAAAAIWQRLQAALDPPTPAALLAIPADALRNVGLSQAKVRYARALAEACEGGLELVQLPADDDAAIAQLCTIKGIGRWTAEIYLLTALQRPDIMPAADIALQVAHQILRGADQRPGAEELRQQTQIWQPYRSYAARLLWHLYRVAKGRDVSVL